MRISFIHSPENYYDQNYGTLFVPLWAYYLASFLPEGWTPEIVDCRIVDLNQCKKADIYAFSGINQDLKAINETWNNLKERYPQATFVIGGPITWSFDQEEKLDLLDHFDFVFILDGEQALNDFLVDFSRNVKADNRVIRSERFPIAEARKIRFDLLDPDVHHYYGAVIEASRGCPFLCEFCDIRVLPNNNKTHTKSISLIIEELDEYTKRGIKKFQLAADNFIGNIRWAEECLDAILKWKEKTGADVSFFTWLTINLYKLPKHMEKMRRCGFSILFIGIESVNRNSLLETAKVQNIKVLEEAVKVIHSYGFIIAPGFIFGFDSDTEKMFDETLEFISETGTIGGDPSFLMALAGTPLYKRMKDSGRLVKSTPDEGIERRKIETNIYYLLDKDFLSDGFIKFVKHFNSYSFQYARFMRHIELLKNRQHYIAMSATGYASPWGYLKLQISHPPYRKMLVRRIIYLLHPGRMLTVFRALLEGGFRSPQNKNDFFSTFFYWIYAWTNMALKHGTLSRSDFSLHSVDKNFDKSKLIVKTTDANIAEMENVYGIKATNQMRYTTRALRRLVEHSG